MRHQEQKLEEDGFSKNSVIHSYQGAPFAVGESLHIRNQAEIAR